MTNAYIMIGLPGSGNTNWVLNRFGLYQNCNVFSLNLLRYQFAVRKIPDLPVLNLRKEPSAKQYTAIWDLCKSQGQMFGRMTDQAMKARLQEIRRGYPLFIDNMNLYAPKREQLIQRCREFGANVVGVFLDTQLETCIERQQKTRGIAREQMEQMYINMDIPGKQEFDEFIVV